MPILLENGDYLLLEDGHKLLLEGEEPVVDAAQYEGIQALQEILQGITYEQFGSCRVIVADRVHVRYVGWTEHPEEMNWDDEVPALVISPPALIPVGGTLNCSDDVVYRFLIQGVDHDLHTMNLDRMHSWMRWQEQIRKRLTEGSLDAHDGVLSTSIPNQDWLDQRQFRTYKNAVFALVAAVTFRESRDPNGG